MVKALGPATAGRASRARNDSGDGLGDGAGRAAADSAELEPLLEYLYRNRGFNFHGYKRSTLLRRIQKRMRQVDAPDFGAYLDRLEVDPEEFSHLFNTILINVTSFFRDGAVWDALREQFVARILPRRGADHPVRIWCAGCASGEEAYTMAIALAELLGPDNFCKNLKIYGTDVDDDALNQARLAAYTERQVADVPPALLEKYFDRAGQKYVVNKELRRCVIFGRHNLIQDAPISRIDVLSCRNALMYFNAETQAKILSSFHFALRDEGVLFLGKAEMMLTHGSLFAPLDLKRRLFAKVPRGPSDLRAGLVLGPVDESRPSPTVLRLREAAFEASPVASIVLDPSGAVACANERARALLGVQRGVLGRPFRDFEVGRQGQLRALVERAAAERQHVTLAGVEWLDGGAHAAFDVHALPLPGADGTSLGVQVSFFDATQQRRLQHELQKAKRDLQTSSEELQSASEELETTNEELQSTVEELETTNEELQSTNEELETMNEELQATNEELQTMNDELRQRSDALNQVNAFFSSILSSLRFGVAVLDHNLLVRAWNHRSEDLWGLRQDEACGKNFFALDIGLPIEQIKGSIRACLAGEIDFQEVVVQATNRRGRAIACKVGCSAIASTADGGDRGAILLMEEINPAVGGAPS